MSLLGKRERKNVSYDPKHIAEWLRINALDKKDPEYKSHVS